MPEPEDPITQLAAGAAQLHELYASFVAAGFTESQALYLVGQALAASIGGSAS
ncbi:hypothetical protein ACQEUU_37385 [Nonomuraea sp. CA-218870]|uniref:hypothetical protein n=1 Tax=Nonomuraea sp. CA-218870 TaxID=3239998 RepID=UPI003D8C31F0